MKALPPPPEKDFVVPEPSESRKTLKNAGLAIMDEKKPVKKQPSFVTELPE